MRWCAAVCFFTLFVAPRVFSQEQERKLIDRLLRPDTELHNNAQDKKFTADRTALQKGATTGTFYLQEKSPSTQFGGTREFSGWEYSARSYQGGKQPANASSGREIVNSDTRYQTNPAVDVRGTNDSKRLVDGRQFAGQRTFLDKGKSQKTLNQQNGPLTIEEVRELLNKNK